MLNGKILLIHKDDSTLALLRAALDRDYQVRTTSNVVEGLQIFQNEGPDIVISALKLPDGMDGIRALEMMKKANPITPIILITAYPDMRSVIAAMRLGAYDYLIKPVDVMRLREQVARALESKNRHEYLVVTNPESTLEDGMERVIIGKSEGMLDVLKKIGQISSSRVSVLIQGESGTGKEMVSRVVHTSGITNGLPFVGVNLSALPESLVESELFGHVKGSFTGAEKDRKGRLETASEGTIFLDEISEIPLNVQVKLLRVIQEREFEPVGDGVVIPMKARIIAATNRNLEELVQQGKFREDLFYRLSVFRIDIPPLRERKEDVPELVVHLLHKINRELHKNIVRIPHEVMQILRNYDWPGNVRELENALMQAVVLAKGDVLEKENLPVHEGHKLFPEAAPNDLSLEYAEKMQIKYVLEKTNWDKTEAARLLNISRQTLYSKIKRYKLG